MCSTNFDIINEAP